MPNTARSLANATANPDNAAQGVANRGSKYGEQFVMPTFVSKHGLGDEGSYFVATNTTPGTAFAYNPQATFSDTVPLVYLFNGAAAGGKSVYLDYIKLITVTAAASGTNNQFALKYDTVARALSADNTTVITPANINSGAAQTSVLGPLKVQNSNTASAIAASSAAAKVVARGSFGAVSVVNDELVMVFGGDASNAYPGLTAAQATGAGRKVSISGPVVIGPQNSLVVHFWSASAAITGMTFEFEMGWAER